MTATGPAGSISVLIFDVNETLLDIEALMPQFLRLFGDAAVLRTWFGELVTYSMTLTLAGYYKDFFTLGQSVLQKVAAVRGTKLTAADLAELADAMHTLPAHSDVAPALECLLDDGYRLVTLTNSPHRPTEASPLHTGGLSKYFEQEFTVDSTGVYKPSTILYRLVAADLDAPSSECMMVVAHTWDIIGAHSAGMRSALITRPGNAPLRCPGVPEPTVIARNLAELARRLGTPSGASATWRSDH